MENLKNLHTLLAETQGEIESWTKFLEKIGQDKTLKVEVKFKVHQVKAEKFNDVDVDTITSFMPRLFNFGMPGDRVDDDGTTTKWARIDDTLVYYISAFVVEKLKETRKELIKQISELA